MTRIPNGAHSAARDFVRWCTAALEALYAGCIWGRLTMMPDIEPMLTTEPLPRSRMCAPTASEHAHSALTLRSNTSSHCSSVTVQDSPWWHVPALLTRMSM